MTVAMRRRTSHASSAPNGNGDASRWIDALYREYGCSVTATCNALLRDRADSEDAAQQVFLSAYRALLNGSRPRSPAAWLGAIARNECRARMRSRGSAPMPTDSSARADPCDEVIRRAELALVWQAIDELPQSQRDAILLREIRGLSYEQLAETLELSRPSVRSLLSRARGQIRRCLEGASAVFGGASWVDALGRLLTAPNAVVSSAPKAAAVSLGLVAIGAGTLTPTLDRHPGRHTRRAVAVPAHVTKGRTAAARAAPLARPAARILIEARPRRRASPAAAPRQRHTPSPVGARARVHPADEDRGDNAGGAKASASPLTARQRQPLPTGAAAGPAMDGRVPGTGAICPLRPSGS